MLVPNPTMNKTPIWKDQTVSHHHTSPDESSADRNHSMEERPHLLLGELVVIVQRVNIRAL